VSCRDGSLHTVTMFGEAMDSADKATNKAMSAAYKYACLQAFCIPTEGMMPDADATTPQPLPKTPAAPVPIREPQAVVKLAESIPERWAEAADEPPIEQQLGASLIAERQKRMDAFGSLKRRYNAIGFARTYPAILGLHGARHSTDFPETVEGLAEARACYKEMLEDVSKREVKGR